MNEIRNTAKLVKQILTEDKAARNSDMYLYLKVCERLNLSAMTKPFYVVVSNLKIFNLPPFETVRRTRQKIQASCPELAGSDEVEEARAELETDFREYAKGAVV